MTNTTSAVSAQAGAAIYSKLVLSVYDVVVIKFSNRWAWRCPSSVILDFYNEHISDNHLDVGVGTGYFLDKFSFASATPRIALVDLNRNSLGKTADRLSRFYPTTHLVLRPVNS